MFGDGSLLAKLISQLLNFSPPPSCFLQWILMDSFVKLKYGDVHCTFSKYNQLDTSRLYVSGSCKYSKDFFETLFVFLLKIRYFCASLRIIITATTKTQLSLINSLPVSKEEVVFLYLENSPLLKCFSPGLINLSLGSNSFFQNN